MLLFESSHELELQRFWGTQTQTIALSSHESVTWHKNREYFRLTKLSQIPTPRMSRYIDRAKKGKVDASPEVVKLFGSSQGRHWFEKMIPNNYLRAISKLTLKFPMLLWPFCMLCLTSCCKLRWEIAKASLCQQHVHGGSELDCYQGDPTNQRWESWGRMAHGAYFASNDWLEWVPSSLVMLK